MTKEELIEKLNEVEKFSRSDEETAHIDADRLLLEYIDDPDVWYAFTNIKKWYS